MCGRVVIGLDSATLAAIARSSSMRFEERYIPSYNIAPGTYIPTTYKAKDVSSKSSQKFILEAMKWGTKTKDNNSLINARSENFSIYYKSWKRCVIIIEGYYEWKQNISQSENSKSHPHYIHNKEQNYFLVAGVYRYYDNDDKNEGDDDQKEKEVVILTKNANEQLKHIHNRMPVLLDETLMEEYLELVRPLEVILKKSFKLSINIHSYPVGDLVNKLSNKTINNLIHKDEIKYDKNKNLKLTNFFKRKNHEPKKNINLNELSDDVNKKIEADKNFILLMEKKSSNNNNNIKIKPTGKRKTDYSPDNYLSKSRKKSTPNTQILYKTKVLTDFVKKLSKK